MTSIAEEKIESNNLVDYSKKDAPWDIHRGQSDDVTAIYALSQEFERYSARMAQCSGILRFARVICQETGEVSLKLKQASFCRVRTCPICQWRRSLMWFARFISSLPSIADEYPKSRWLFLTLTVRNCDINELGNTITAMNSAWQRLIKRKEFAPIKGWIRTTEVTLGKDNTAHPHFHALLMVSPRWFGADYVTQARFVELWRECGKLDYDPVLDIRIIKPRAGKTDIQSAASETLKYAVKPSDMINNPEWFLELTRQIHKRRFIATGGALKDVLKLEKEKNEDFTAAGKEGTEQGDDDRKRIAFGWKKTERKYKRVTDLDR